jgi:hypothetical protein
VSNGIQAWQNKMSAADESCASNARAASRSLRESQNNCLPPTKSSVSEGLPTAHVAPVSEADFIKATLRSFSGTQPM